MIPKFKFAEGYVAQDNGVENVEKMAFVPQNTKRKGKLSMDPMVESPWKSKDYSAPAKETI